MTSALEAHTVDPNDAARTADDIDAALAELGVSISPSNEGLFGPGSVLWRVNRESIAFVGAGSALLLQVAHPWVAQAVADHSVFSHDPLGRYYRTFVPIFAMLFGTTEDAIRQAKKVNAIHNHIKGTMAEPVGPFPAGSTYYANHASALLWVHATLWKFSLDLYERMIEPLTQEERDRYYEETKVFAALFGLRKDDVPQDLEAFNAYFDDMCQSDVLTVGSAALDVRRQLFVKPQHLVTRIIPRWYQDVTSLLLPEPLQEKYQMVPNEKSKHRAERALRHIHRLYHLHPKKLRWAAPYHEAMGRLRGRKGPDPIVRALNYMWLGRSSLTAATRKE